MVEPEVELVHRHLQGHLRGEVTGSQRRAQEEHGRISGGGRECLWLAFCFCLASVGDNQFCTREVCTVCNANEENASTFCPSGVSLTRASILQS